MILFFLLTINLFLKLFKIIFSSSIVKKIIDVKKYTFQELNVYHASHQWGYPIYPIRTYGKITRNQCKPLWWPH